MISMKSLRIRKYSLGRGGKGGRRGLGTWDSGHLVDFPRDFPRGRNASGAGKGQGKTPPKRGGRAELKTGKAEAGRERDLPKREDLASESLSK